MWIAGWNLGVVRDRDDAAMIGFIKRQAKVDHTRFLHHHADATSAIEGLKAWLARDGGVDWTHDRVAPGWTQANGYRIAIAQFNCLVALNPKSYGHFLDLSHCLIALGFAAAPRQTDAGWIAVMNSLGDRIRAASRPRSG